MYILFFLNLYIFYNLYKFLNSQSRKKWQEYCERLLAYFCFNFFLLLLCVFFISSFISFILKRNNYGNFSVYIIQIVRVCIINYKINAKKSSQHAQFFCGECPDSKPNLSLSDRSSAFINLSFNRIYLETIIIEYYFTLEGGNLHFYSSGLCGKRLEGEKCGLRGRKGGKEITKISIYLVN